MPIIKSAIKHMRSDKRKALQNKEAVSELKSLFRKIVAIAAQDIAKAELEARHLISKLDKAAQKRIIPKKRADRKKTRLAALLKKFRSSKGE